MKKSTVRVTVILLVVIVGVVAFYTYLVNSAQRKRDEAKMTPVQLVLNRDLENDYPATVKEVVKYYTEIENCLYNEDCSDGEIEALGMQARKLYDSDLQANNEMAGYLERLKAEFKSFKDAERKVTSISVAGSANVDDFSEDGYDFARIYCGYTIRDKDGQVHSEGRVFLLRKDENRRWKIYGWDNSDNVHVGEE